MNRLVIAHRGASGYVPEHTLAAKALAHGLGADFIEQDVVLTGDGHPIVVHDIHLETVTDAARVFPDRARDDGRFYAIDFTLDEIRRLSVHERVDPATGQAVYARRFPVGRSRFGIATLAEELELIQGLNASTGRDVGIYPEIKAPGWHRAEGHDITRTVLAELERFGYTDRDDNVYVQCFDPREVERMRRELGSRLKLVVLIGENEWDEAPVDYDALRTPEGLRAVAAYADGIGPWLPHLVRRDAERWTSSGLVESAHALSLAVHPYTVRADDLPEFARDVDELLRLVFDELAVDGVFSDHPDRVIEFLRR